MENLSSSWKTAPIWVKTVLTQRERTFKPSFSYYFTIWARNSLPTAFESTVKVICGDVAYIPTALALIKTSGFFLSLLIKEYISLVV